MPDTSPIYRGRFAPSPSGPLHFGSLIAAAGSYLDAKAHQGEWLVRMEDLDPPREVAGAADSILRTLDAYGFEWDGDVVYQSQRYDLYAAALEQLNQQDLLYYCECTRKGIIARCPQGQWGAVYDGLCRSKHREKPTIDNAPYSVRIKVDNAISYADDLQGRREFPHGSGTYADRLQGAVSQNLVTEIGDFHLLRKDGLYAYHLGVVVDDAEQGITDIVRGYDLLDSTPRQIYLQQQLGHPTPRYAHLPLALKPDGDKLSKQTKATGLDNKHPVPALWEAIKFLGQDIPTELQQASLAEVWNWAFEHWAFERIPHTTGVETHIL